MDNMDIRKAQLKKLDDFVKTLYDECQVFSQYMNMKDLEMLYLHIHELIEEMLQCKNTDEFMAMIEDLHRAVAGVLIIAVPANAGQVMSDMKEAHADFEGKDFDEMLKNLQKTSVQKYGGKSKVNPQEENEEDYEEPDNDPDELVDMLDLKDQIKPTKKKKKRRETPSEQPKSEETPDPFSDIYNDFN